MSRVAKNPVVIPAGVDVKIASSEITIKDTGYEHLGIEFGDGLDQFGRGPCV